MINASKEFRSTIKNRTNFIETAKITFKDGRILNLNQEDFSISGNTVSDSAGSTSFPLGVAVGKIIRIEIFNDNDRLSSYDFYEAVIDLRLSLELSENTEVLNYGTYTVIEPETYGETVIVQAMDNMYKADKDYSTSLNFPVSLGAAMLDSAQTCGVTLLTTTFKNDNFMIQQAPEGITHRTFWAMAAMIACGFARINYNGQLCITSYDFSAFNEGIADLDGGIFDSDTPYSSGDDADGGTFNPWNTGHEYDSGMFDQMENYHVFYDFGTLTVATDDVVITGIETTVDEIRYLSGNEGYTLSIENQLIAGQEQSAIDLIAQSIVGIRFRPFEGEHIAYPLAEFGDLAYIIDRKNNAYQTILTDVDFEFSNVTTFKCSAESPLRNSGKYNSQLTQAVVAARKDTEKQLSNYDINVQNMTSIMANSLGIFESYENTENGGKIAYQHNKPNREDSDIIWRKSEQGFQVSTDGGDSWNAGITADGNAVLNVLSAIGIRFDWAQGGTLTLGGSGNGNGLLRILDSSDTQIGHIGNTGVHFEEGTISGATVTGGTVSGAAVTGGTISGTTITGSSVNGTNMTGGTISGTTITGATVTGSVISSEAPSSISMIRIADGRIVLYSSSTLSGYIDSYGTPKSGIIIGSQDRIHLRLTNASQQGINMQHTNGEVTTSVDGHVITDSLSSGSILGTDIQAFNFTATNTKSRIVDTDNYGTQSLYCYEMATPYFGDIGFGKTDENGICIVPINDVFAETTEENTEYCVFLQKEQEGDIWVFEKEKRYFIVKGSSNTPFSWEIKSIQKGLMFYDMGDYNERKTYDFENVYQEDLVKELSIYDHELDISCSAIKDLKNYDEETEVMLYEFAARL